jgi:hypothetical protein
MNRALKKDRIRSIRKKILGLEVNLRNLLKNIRLSRQRGERTISLTDFRKVIVSFLSLAECYESLLEIYEMDADTNALRTELKGLLTNGWSDRERNREWNSYLEDDVKPYWPKAYTFLKETTKK